MLWINLWQNPVDRERGPNPLHSLTRLIHNRISQTAGIWCRLKTSQSPMPDTEFLPFLLTLTYFLSWKASAIHCPIFRSEIQKLVYLPHSSPCQTYLLLNKRKKSVSDVYSSLLGALGYSYGLDVCFTCVLTLSGFLAPIRDYRLIGNNTCAVTLLGQWKLS